MIADFLQFLDLQQQLAGLSAPGQDIGQIQVESALLGR